MQISLLEKGHNRKNFSCEEAALTQYLQLQVSQDIKKGLVVCYVALDEQQHVIGYYTLTSESLGRDLIPEKYAKQLPISYTAPVILLGRLARDVQTKGSGLGEHLLLDALFRAYDISKKSLGAMAVVVDPISDYARAFYLKYGFLQLPDSGRLFLPMGVIRQLIRPNEFDE